MQGETFSRKSFPLHPFQKALTKEKIGRAQTDGLFVGEAFRLPKTSNLRKQKRAIRESPLRDIIKFIVGAKRLLAISWRLAAFHRSPALYYKYNTNR